MSWTQKQLYVWWLREYAWIWFCTLTVRSGIRRKAADRLFRRWIAALMASYDVRPSWVRCAEYGTENRMLHFHAMLAGVECVPISAAERLWTRMAGTARIREYDAERRGLEYSLKSIELGPDYDLDAVLLSEHHTGSQRQG